MLDLKDNEFFIKADTMSVDFYLEDDMFEIEGKFSVEGDDAYIIVIDAVSHMLKIAGNKLKIGKKYGRFTASRVEDGKTFDLEINRVFIPLENPSVEDFQKEFDKGTKQFFNKMDDTLIWYDIETEKWNIEVNKINMFCSGDRYQYDTIGQMFEDKKDYLAGKWQCIYFSAEVEEDEEEF
ncbi:hypothetical protein [Peptostreptococcus equinus]|uniref:DUF2262 domain-containing protein n=1 Tax=Peptostreptococcus equinus TaxID=3003601 RepID=A0ABY7JML3_9FIRM|nr:hypothetical protein [Peptostreptococcus sp. CBA3647]WAW14577.1 hypothetical protein O0R46_08230 [Peptostreptococcus sp. CBA3647]